MMFLKKLAIFFIFSFHAFSASGKLFLPKYIGNGNVNIMHNQNPDNLVSNKTLWILDLNNIMDIIRLRSGNEAEEKDFDVLAGPVINSLKTRSKRIKKDNPEKYYEQFSKNEAKDLQNKDLKNEIMTIINKFVLTVQNEPDSYLTDSGDETQNPSLALYFKGPFTSLVVKLEPKQWHYVISPPSPLPDWFYEDHTNITRENQAVYVDISDIVKNEFYKSFLPLLRTLLSFPV